MFVFLNVKIQLFLQFGWLVLSVIRAGGPAVIKLLPCSTQLSTKFILLINVKMQFISMMNTTSERLKARNFLICGYFMFYEQLKFRGQLN